MDQKELIKALVKVLREDIKKTLKEEIRKAVHEVLNEQVSEPTQKPRVNEDYQFKSKDDGGWGRIDYSQRQAAPTRPMISPDMLGYGDGFNDYMQPEQAPASNRGGRGDEEYGSYLQGQEEGGIPLHVKAQIAAQRNPQATAPVLKALNRDYSQLVKKFNKG